MQDIPANLKAEVEPEEEGGPQQQQQHRKELKSPPLDVHPLGYYFQKDAHKGGLTGASGDQAEGAGPEAKPLKFYFSKDITDHDKRQLAFKAMMKAQMDGVERQHKFSR